MSRMPHTVSLINLAYVWGAIWSIIINIHHEICWSINRHEIYLSSLSILKTVWYNVVNKFIYIHSTTSPYCTNYRRCTWSLWWCACVYRWGVRTTAHIMWTEQFNSPLFVIKQSSAACLVRIAKQWWTQLWGNELFSNCNFRIFRNFCVGNWRWMKYSDA